jgi:nitroimidazol reductase NimA-like FMN-containing flavoprotein (pyridoxamine 5'-phosphate oxidase superfamily)
MRLFDSRTGVEIIERKECLELLAGEEVGRVGILDGGSPLVLPVTYGMDGDAVVFRTGPGSKLHASRGSAGCFEIDGYDREHHTGWSVVVRGHLDEVTKFDPELLQRTADVADPWLPGPLEHVVRLSPTTITGRRIAQG